MPLENGGNGPPRVIIISEALSDDGYLWATHDEITDTYTANGLNQYTDINGSVPVYDGPAREGAPTESPAHILMMRFAKAMTRAVLL